MKASDGSSGAAVGSADAERGEKCTAADAVQVTLLDGFELRCGDEVVGLPMSAQRVVAFLALRSHSLQRAFVAGNLWFGASGSGAEACLRSTLWRIRRLSPSPVLATSRTHVQLAPHVAVDVREHVAAAQRAFDREVALDDIAWHGLVTELLPDWCDDWVLVERERLRQLRLHALEALALRFAEHGRFGEAVDTAYAAVRADPLRESARRTLIRVYLAEGNRTEAVRDLERYCVLVRNRLGAEPSPDLSVLVQRPSLRD